MPTVLVPHVVPVPLTRPTDCAVALTQRNVHQWARPRGLVMIWVLAVWLMATVNGHCRSGVAERFTVTGVAMAVRSSPSGVRLRASVRPGAYTGAVWVT